MNMEQTPTERLKASAFELGEMLADAGDFYDVVEELAKGYAAGFEARPGGQRDIALQIGALFSLQAAANTVIEWRVDDGRAALMSWSDIGETMDMTKQAAQQRFGKKP